MHDVGDTDAAGLGDFLQPRGDVDAIAEDIVVIEDDVAQVDADAILDTGGFGFIGFPISHGCLNRHGALDGIEDTGELDEQAVSRALDDMSMVFVDRRVDQFAAVHLLAHDRAFLVKLHEARKADHVGNHNCGETAFHSCVPVVILPERGD